MNSGTIGGLSHLVEAASALSKLGDVAAQSPAAAAASPGVLGPAPSEEQIQIVSAPPTAEVSDDESKRETPVVPPLSSREIFPQRMMQVLSDASLSDVISWLPHGRSFVIIRPDVFAERVLPRYFSADARSTKYPSFTRKLNRWGFRQATRGPDTGAFHHPLFRRDEPAVCLNMVCQKSRKGSASSTANKGVSSNHKKSSASALSKAPATTALTKESLATLPNATAHTREVSVVSGDDTASETTTTALGSSPATALRPFVVNDPQLVANILKAQEMQEKAAVAKSMLYQAYLSALKQHQ